MLGERTQMEALCVMYSLYDNAVLCLILFIFQTRLYAAQAARKVEAAEHVKFQPQEVQVSDSSVLFHRDASVWPATRTALPKPRPEQVSCLSPGGAHMDVLSGLPCMAGSTEEGRARRGRCREYLYMASGAHVFSLPCDESEPTPH